MVCHECGKTVGDDDRFCTGCGTRLQASTAPQEPAADDAVAAPPAAPPEASAVPATDATDEPADVAGDPGATAGTAATDRPRPSATADPGAPSDTSAATADSAGATAASSAAVGPPGSDPAADPGASAGAATEPTRPQPAASTASDRADLRTELMPVVDDEDDWGDSDPVWAATAATPIVASEPASVTTGDLPSTEPNTEVWMGSVPDAPTRPTPYDFVEREPVTATQVVPTATAEMPATAPAAAPGRRFRFGAVAFLGIVSGLVVLASLFTTIISVTSDVRLTIGADAPFGFRTGRWIADDLADNLSIAGLVAAVLMVAGGVAASFGWRWGSGLAGGAGLATAGLAGLVLGLAQIPIDAAHEFARIPPEEPFTLTITRDLGYWLTLTAAALGIVLFFASINDAFGDRRPGLNPWIAALGALATLVAAAGPLLPENFAVFSDNWYVVEAPGEAPALLLAGRLVQLGLLAVSGVVGYLSVRRWGLGVAIGGALPIVWLAISTLFDLTDFPVGPGFRNPGAEDMHLHGVTIIGVSAVAAMAILAAIAAYDQAVRERL